MLRIKPCPQISFAKKYLAGR